MVFAQMAAFPWRSRAVRGVKENSCHRRASVSGGIINIPGRPQTSLLLLKWGWQKVFKFSTTFAQTNQLFTRVLINSSVLISRDLQRWKNNQRTCSMCGDWQSVRSQQKFSYGLITSEIVSKNTIMCGERGSGMEMQKAKWTQKR